MVLNDALPEIEIDPERYTVTIDGERIEPQARGGAAAGAALFPVLRTPMVDRVPIPIRCSSRSPGTRDAASDRAADERARSPARAAAGRGARRRASSRWSCRPARCCIPGRCCITTDGRVLRRRAAPTRTCWSSRPRDIAEAARVGHLIGNLHRDIEVDGDGDVVALGRRPRPAPDIAFARAPALPFERGRAAPFHGRAARRSTRIDSGARPGRAAAAAAAVRLAVSGRRLRALRRPRDLRGSSAPVCRSCAS